MNGIVLSAEVRVCTSAEVLALGPVAARPRQERETTPTALGMETNTWAGVPLRHDVGPGGEDDAAEPDAAPVPVYRG